MCVFFICLCLTGSQRTICLWFQGELPVDSSIFNPPMYKTLLALWDLQLDTCRRIYCICELYVNRRTSTKCTDITRLEAVNRKTHTSRFSQPLLLFPCFSSTCKIFPVRGSRTRTRLSLDVTASLLPSLLKLTDSSSVSDG